MRYVLLFNEENKQEGIIHYSGLLLNPDEEVKKLNHPNFKRFSEEVLTELCGEDFEQKMHFIELNEQDEPFFNQQRYEESLLAEDQPPQ